MAAGGKIVPEKCTVEKIAGGFKFLEGPAWSFQDSGFLIFSDVRENVLYRYEPGKVQVVRKPGRGCNGNAFTEKGELITCENRPARLALTGRKNENLTLAYEYQGNPLRSPNDLTLKTDGSIWFTDPGGRRRGEDTNILITNRVYRLDPSGKLHAAVEDVERPNGLCFSPDEKKLYVADSKARNIRVYEVNAANQATNSAVFCTIANGNPDGIKCDRDGNVYSSGGEGISIFSPKGELIGLIKTKEAPSNLAFGPNQSLLFLTARTSLYLIKIVRE